jgi:hypothetical protein
MSKKMHAWHNYGIIKDIDFYVFAVLLFGSAGIFMLIYQLNLMAREPSFIRAAFCMLCAALAIKKLARRFLQRFRRKMEEYQRYLEDTGQIKKARYGK